MFVSSPDRIPRSYTGLWRVTGIPGSQPPTLLDSFNSIGSTWRKFPCRSALRRKRCRQGLPMDRSLRDAAPAYLYEVWQGLNRGDRQDYPLRLNGRRCGVTNRWCTGTANASGKRPWISAGYHRRICKMADGCIREGCPGGSLPAGAMASTSNRAGGGAWFPRLGMPSRLGCAAPFVEGRPEHAEPREGGRVEGRPEHAEPREGGRRDPVPAATPMSGRKEPSQGPPPPEAARPDRRTRATTPAAGW